MAAAMERRGGRRQDTDVAVRFVALPATIGAGRIINISLTGAFMETACKLPLLAVVHIEGLDTERAHDRRAACKRLAAKVVRRCTAGVGLEWCVPRRTAPAAQSAADADLSADADPPADSESTADAGRSWCRLDFID